MKYNEKKQLIESSYRDLFAVTRSKSTYSYDSKGNMDSSAYSVNYDGSKWEKISATEYFFKPGATAINKKKELEFRVFPNPVKDFIIIEVDGLMTNSGRLYNTHGQQVRIFPLVNGTNTFNINHLDPGVYILQVPTQKYLLRKKIVKN
jgi:hypothetical protein